MKLRIFSPASTANLGAGFDTLGIALELYNIFELEESDKTVIETVPKRISLEIPERNLFYRVLKESLNYLGMPEKDFYIRQYNNIPISRGLGSSASVIVAGIVSAFKIANKELKDDEFFKLAYKFEPHPDNLIPALKGGFITALKSENRTYYNSIYFPDDIRFVVVIPELELSTEKAREVLPKNIPLGDAIFNIQRVAMFISALKNRRYDLLKVAMEDKLHQPYRKKLIPNFDKLLESAYSKGALGVSLSGAGSTILALANNKFDEIGLSMVSAFKEVGIEAEYKVLRMDKSGVKIEIIRGDTS